MAVTTPGFKASQDWALLLAEFEAYYVPQERMVKDFAADHGLNEKTVRASFARQRKKAVMATLHDRNKPIMLKMQQEISVQYAKLADPESEWYNPQQAGKFALDVLKELFEREEPNPTLTQQVNIITPPMFPPSSLANKAIEALTGIAPKKVDAKVIG